MIEYILWILFPIMFYFTSIKPKQDREKKEKSFKVNDLVITTFGLFGTIKTIKNDFVILAISKNVDIKILLSAISEKRNKSHD